MAKRYTDSDVWKRQRWFKKLSKDYKLVFFYIKDMCDSIGVWKIDCADLMEDVGLDEFDLDDFIRCLNYDHDKINGKKQEKIRLKMINEKELWVTGFVQFQYENRDTGKVCPTHVIARSALDKLRKKGLYQEAVKQRYLFVNEIHSSGSGRAAVNGSRPLRAAAGGGGHGEREREEY